MKVGARNRITATVTDITRGKVMCLVKVDVPARSRMASVMTLESLKELGIKKDLAFTRSHPNKASGCRCCKPFR